MSFTVQGLLDWPNTVHGHLDWINPVFGWSAIHFHMDLHTEKKFRMDDHTTYTVTCFDHGIFLKSNIYPDGVTIVLVAIYVLKNMAPSPQRCWIFLLLKGIKESPIFKGRNQDTLRFPRTCACWGTTFFLLSLLHPFAFCININVNYCTWPPHPPPIPPKWSLRNVICIDIM